MRRPYLRLAAGAVAAVIIALYFNLWFSKQPLLAAPGPYVGGILVLVMLYALYVVLTGDIRLWNVAVGADGRASTSKFQMLLWLGVVLFGYVVVMTDRVQLGHSEPLQNIPPNVLLALGLAIGTATVSKAVTTSNVESLRDAKAPTSGMGLAPLVQGDDGRPDLAKIQLLAWTVVAIGVYLNLLVSVVSAATRDAPPNLPDIDPSLLILMGIGSGAYIGRKLVTTSTPYITSINKGAAAPGDVLFLTGANFGNAGRLVLGRSDTEQAELQTGVTSWTDTRIEFNAPAPDSTRHWPAGQALQLSVLATTGPSANSVDLTLTA